MSIRKVDAMNEMYPNFTEPRFKGHLCFEIFSWIGRHFKKRKSRINCTGSPLLLDLGVGLNYRSGWTHVDFYRIKWRFWQKYSRGPEIETDLRYPLNCSSNIVDGVYCGHTLEHLYPNHAYGLLGEIYRVLKSQCWLRITVPDLKRVVDFYNGSISIPKYRFGVEAISDITQNWGHHSAWDEELLSYALKRVGFINIRKVEFGKEGADERLIKEEEVRKSETLVMEAQKT